MLEQQIALLSIVLWCGTGLLTLWPRVPHWLAHGVAVCALAVSGFLALLLVLG